MKCFPKSVFRCQSSVPIGIVSVLLPFLEVNHILLLELKCRFRNTKPTLFRSVSLLTPHRPSDHIQVTAQRLLLPVTEPSPQTIYPSHPTGRVRHLGFSTLGLQYNPLVPRCQHHFVGSNNSSRSAIPHGLTFLAGGHRRKSTYH